MSGAAGAEAPGSGGDAGGERRRRGRRPADAAERRRRVERAVADLTSVRVPFTMADVAERAGISRATLYRDAGLRDLVGRQGDGPAKRPVNSREYERLHERTALLAAERRALRQQVRELEERVRATEERLTAAEQALRSARREAHRASAAAEGATGSVDSEGGSGSRSGAYKEGFAAGFRAATQRPGAAGSGRPGSVGGAAGAAPGELRSVAARLPKATLVAARRTLARQLHPDLFAKDPAAAMLATELLKQINALIGSG